MSSNRTVKADTIVCDVETLSFVEGFDFYDLQNDMNCLSEDEISIVKGIRKIAFPCGVYDVDEEVWRALDQEDCECLDNVEWLDFTNAEDLVQSLCLSGIPSLEKLVLPPNMDDIAEAMIYDCPNLSEIHIHQLGNIGCITSDCDGRLNIYASALTDDFFDSFADDDNRNDFAEDVDTLFVPAADMDRVRKLMDEYPSDISLEPLPDAYKIPTA